MDSVFHDGRYCLAHHSMLYAEHWAWTLVGTQIFVEQMHARDKP